MKGLKARTWSAAESAAESFARLNEGWRDLRSYLTRTDDVTDAAITIDKLSAIPAISVYADITQAVASGGLPVLAMNKMEYVTGLPLEQPTFNQTTNGVTIRRRGLYHIMSRVAFGVPGGGGRTSALIQVNADYVAQVGIPNKAGETTQSSATRTYVLNVGDVVYAVAFQNSGGPLNTTVGGTSDMPLLQVQYVGEAPVIPSGDV
jgi:hypothetical protein